MRNYFLLPTVVTNNGKNKMNRKAIIYKFIILVIILSSCSQGNNYLYEEESLLLHSAIREIILNSEEYNSAIVQFETKPIYKTFYNQKGIYPQPPGTLIFSGEIFDLLIEKGFLIKDDAEFMLSKIDSTRIFYIDSLKINKSIIPKRQLDSIFSGNKGNAYKKLISNFSTNSFIRFGTPMINLKKTKLLITTEFYSFSEMNQRLIYILTYDNNKWKITNKLDLM